MTSNQKQVLGIMCDLIEADYWVELQQKCEEQDIDLDDMEDIFDELKDQVNN